MRTARTWCCVLLALLACASEARAQAGEYDWLSARYEWTGFDDGTAHWDLLSAELGARRATVTGILRVNHAARFGARGDQVEADLYPVWPGRGYAYLSAGYAPDPPFPRLRLAAEAYAALPHAFEASLGGVDLDFRGTRVPMLTGSVAKYAGNWWVSLRPYWLPDQDQLTLALAARRYLRSADRYVTARVIRGSAPENLQTGADVGRLHSWTGSLDAQIELSRRWFALPLLSVTREELSASRRRVRTTLGLGLLRRF